MSKEPKPANALATYFSAPIPDPELYLSFLWNLTLGGKPYEVTVINGGRHGVHYSGTPVAIDQMNKVISTIKAAYDDDHLKGQGQAGTPQRAIDNALKALCLDPFACTPAIRTVVLSQIEAIELHTV